MNFVYFTIMVVSFVLKIFFSLLLYNFTSKVKCSLLLLFILMNKNCKSTVSDNKR